MTIDDVGKVVHLRFAFKRTVLRNRGKSEVQVPTGTTEFASPALSRAMFDIYLGDSPVSPNGKQAMAEGLIKLCG